MVNFFKHFLSFHRGKEKKNNVKKTLGYSRICKTRVLKYKSSNYTVFLNKMSKK